MCEQPCVGAARLASLSTKLVSSLLRKIKSLTIEESEEERLAPVVISIEDVAS